MSKCHGCGAEIIWAITAGGKHIPLDPIPEKRFVYEGHEALQTDNPVLVRNTYVSHFATCPKANEFRKEKKE